MTPPDDQVPINPGQPYEPPTQPFPPPPAYYQPAPPPQPATSFRPGRVAGNTVVVIVTIVALVCGIPLLLCGCTAALGTFTSH